MDTETRQTLDGFFTGPAVVVQPMGGHPATEMPTRGFLDSFTNLMSNVGDSLTNTHAAGGPQQDFWNTPSIQVPKLSEMLAGEGISELGNIQPAEPARPKYRGPGLT